ncbi:FkbM family methyltransferase [Chitinophaga sp.]|uniref:FkbM family methyltransferase n=1 Tax=Chitinophaga sp. TaxID=1869181 RepID=UPI00262C02CD|nr:FkbM family methyltransferase [uncultured Chitinophaga sp.]
MDVGALHPKRFSNTYKFYRKGWRGINIDAMPGSMAEFRNIRPEDINLEIPVSDKAETLDFYIFNEPALNTFSKELAEERSQKAIYHVEKVVKVQTDTLSGILDAHLPAGKAIDFLTIDAEGLDYQVLVSNNWTKYRPKVVLIESELDIRGLMGSESDRLLEANGYGLYAKTVKTYFYKLKEFTI